MAILTPEEITLLESDERFAAVATKLKNEHSIPKSRLDEVIAEKKALAEKLAAKEAAEQAAESDRLTKQGEFKALADSEKAKREAAEAQLATEKATADQYRSYVKAKKGTAKETLGESWMPEYDGDNFSLESIEKIVAKATGATPAGTVVVPPGKSAPVKKLSEMTAQERETAIAKAKQS